MKPELTRVLVLSSRSPWGWEGGLHEFEPHTRTDLKGNVHHAARVVRHPCPPLFDALRASYSTDAHFCPYAFSRNGELSDNGLRIKRVALEGGHLSKLEADLVFTCLAVDVDADEPGSREIRDDPVKLLAWREQQAQILRACDWRSSAAYYETGGGYRLVWLLPTPMHWTKFAAYAEAFKDELHRCGVRSDPLCKDLQRMYRLPGAIGYRGLDLKVDLDELDVLTFQPTTGTSASPESTFKDIWRPDRSELGPLPDKVVKGIPGPGRATVAFRIAIGDHHRGRSPRAILAGLLAQDEEGYFDPPLGRAELERTVRNATSYPRDSNADIEAQVRAEAAQVVAAQAAAQATESTSTPVAAPVVDAGYGAPAPPSALPVIHHGSEVVYAGIALGMIEGDGVPFVAAEREHQRYLPDRGVWTPVKEDACKASIRLLDTRQVQGKPSQGNPSGVSLIKMSNKLCKDVYQLTLDIRSRAMYFENAPKGIAFRNAFVTPDGVLPHAPDNRARHGLDFDFDPDAKAPLWEVALEQWTAPLGDDAPRVRRLLAQFAGGALFGMATRFEKAMVLYGYKASNGKSQFINVLSSLFPRGSLAAVPPQLMADMNARAKLRVTRLNVVSELPEADILRSEALKAFVTGELVEARAVYERGFDYTPQAAHLFAANRLPFVQDTTDGFWRRWLVVPFLATFKPGGKGYIRDLSERIVAAELPGVAAWAVRGARDLFEEDAYDVPGCCDEALRQWRLAADQVANFIEDRTETTANRAEFIRASDLFQAYLQWQQENIGPAGKPVGQKNFSRRLLEIGISVDRRENANHYPLKISQKGSKNSGFLN